MPVRILAVGDMHLGRRPSRLPAALADDGARLGPAEAWERCVRLAIEQQVDAVALAGDLVEREDDFFEAYRLLLQGIRQLDQAGITVVGVAGNHDVTVLPRLADELEGFHLLGRGGTWERLTLGADEDRVTLHGWSFPSRRVTTSPLAGHDFHARGEGAAAGVHLGLLHADRDARDSHYAPVSSAELAAAGLDAWLLGHIHRPDALDTLAGPGTSSAAPRYSGGYLGSVTGLHPGEHGPRGPWLITVEGERIRAIEQQCLAPLHWARLDLDLTGLEAPEQARTRLLQRLRELEARLDTRPCPPRALGLRLRLTGQTTLAGEVAHQLEEHREESIAARPERFTFIERILADTRPPVDLDELARRQDHAGLLARRLQLLEHPADDPDRRALLEQARERLASVATDARWRGLPEAGLDDEAVAARLADSGSRLLEHLLADPDTEARP
ncbi:DNA repair exonuclease [Thioalkalivibrio sp. ALE19]|uniref:DNA repair exonuclease n=1 Tax=Thioalkalivibrio sp. ALE19 TaxID=1266909 RepID=UPI0003FB88A9|nr:DNA repair exonuclease [Thioalkalivibrio sp. ALE19]